MGEPLKAKRKTETVNAEETHQHLTFMLGGEMFGIAIKSVREIIEYGNLTEVPMVPPFIRGVINLRGAVVPVIDLSARFGGKPTQIQRRTCIVIIEMADGSDTQELGVVVDAVCEVLDIPESEIEPAPSFGAKIRADFIAGMGKINGKFVILLDVRRVLSVDEIAELAALSQEDVEHSLNAEE